MKNAHEALERYGKKQVMLSMVNEKDYIRIDVENRIPADIGVIDVSRTSKEDSKNHGFGIRSVRKTVEDNGGMFTQFVRDEFFVSEVWLLIIFD